MELNDVASSSSSSSSSSSPQSNHEDDSGSDHEVDQSFAYELRSALHLAVGKICLAEDNAERDDAGMSSGSPALAMSKDAIVALTDLTYHYSTSLFANDLVAFSKHAKRATVKTDDVLLMARKDRKGMLAELKRVMADNPIYTEGTKKPKLSARSRSSSGVAAARKKASTKSKGNKNRPNSKPKSASRSVLSSSSSSSSSSSDDSEDDVVKQRRRKLDLQRNNLNKRGSYLSGAGRDDGHDFIAKDDTEDNSESSSSGNEFEFGAPNSQKKASGEKKAKALQKGRNSYDSTESDKSSDSDHGRKTKSSGSLSENMVIDLAGD
ncbi:hypothetical protein ACHAXR_004862 [Thalassiosira sp. AJA248-18]